MVSIQGGRREERIRTGWAYHCMVQLGLFQHPPPGGRTLVHCNGDLPSVNFAGTRLFNRLSKRRCERINKIFNFSVVTFLVRFPVLPSVLSSTQNIAVKTYLYKES